MFEWYKKWKAKRAAKKLSKGSFLGFLVKLHGRHKVYKDKEAMKNVGQDGIWRPPVDQANELLELIKKVRDRENLDD